MKACKTKGDSSLQAFGVNPLWFGVLLQFWAVGSRTKAALGAPDTFSSSREPAPFSPKSAPKSPFQFVVETELSFAMFGIPLIAIFWLAASLPMITEEGILTEGGNPFLW